jgi:YHS domain-containing protein
MAKIILWIVLITIVVRMGWRFVHAIMEGAGLLEGSSPPESVKLVRDPVCGVFVVPAKALTAGSGESTKYFCSEKCRKAWSGQ